MSIRHVPRDLLRAARRRSKRIGQANDGQPHSRPALRHIPRDLLRAIRQAVKRARSTNGGQSRALPAIRHVPRNVLRVIRTAAMERKRIYRGRSHTLPGKLIVSLTSYPPRFATLHLTLRCLLNQDMAPDALMLWIAHDEIGRLPKRVLDLRDHGLIIRECDNLRSYKKILPVLKEHSDAFIITADDDYAYPPDLVRSLVEEHNDRREIVSNWALRMQRDFDGRLSPIAEWPDLGARDDRTAREAFYVLTGSGALFPPAVFDREVMDVDRAAQLCPTGDDIWLSWMAARAGARCRVLRRRLILKAWPGTDAVGLWLNHNRYGGNDRQIASMIEAYGPPVDPMQGFDARALFRSGIDAEGFRQRA